MSNLHINRRKYLKDLRNIGKDIHTSKVSDKVSPTKKLKGEDVISNCPITSLHYSWINSDVNPQRRQHIAAKFEISLKYSWILAIFRTFLKHRRLPIEMTMGQPRFIKTLTTRIILPQCALSFTSSVSISAFYSPIWIE